MINLLNKVEWDKKKIVILIAVCLALVCLDFITLLKFQIQQIKKPSSPLKELKTDIDNLNKELATLQELKNKQKEIKTASTKVKKIISEEQITPFLQRISELANKNKVVMLQITPSKDITGKGKKTVEEEPKFPPLFLTLDLTCDYHDFGRFINDLENAEEFVDIDDIKIEPDKRNYLKENIKLTLRTYVKK
jgi:Tfp pilus assembly protein PilO